jgi:hypothetical protein
MRNMTMLKERNPHTLQGDVRVRKHGKNKHQRNDKLRLQRSRGTLPKKIGKTDMANSERPALLL